MILNCNNDTVDTDMKIMKNRKIMNNEKFCIQFFFQKRRRSAVFIIRALGGWGIGENDYEALTLSILVAQQAFAYDEVSTEGYICGARF